MSIERAPGPKRSAETSQAAGPAAPGNAAGSLIDRVRRLDAVAALPRRYRLQVRAGLLEETLKLATYSAVTHLIIAAAVAYFFWTSAPQAYLLGLLAWVAVVIVAATYLTWRYLRTYASAVSPAGVRWGCPAGSPAGWPSPWAWPGRPCRWCCSLRPTATSG